jgi:hypothetical protein
MEYAAIDAYGEPRLARAEIAKHVEKITLHPDGRTYVASGTSNCLVEWLLEWCRGPDRHDAATG